VLARLASVVLIVAVLAATARAERIVAVAPLSTLDAEDKSAATKKLTGEIEAAVVALGGIKVVSAVQVADAIKKSKKSQLKACEGDVSCLAELGKLVNAEIVIAGQVGGLGDAKIIYLSATTVATGKELRSTTLSVGAKDDPGGATGAVIRLLDPDKYRGMLHFAIDVGGASVFVNGSKVALSPKGELALPVGTQAVRVTHPEYRDFVKFIDVPFGKTLDVPVGMTQYPIIQNDIRGNPINRDKVVYVDPPVWRRWYVVGPAAVGLAILTGIIVGVAVHDLPNAPCKKVGGENC
jgi:hypothetical protein